MTHKYFNKGGIVANESADTNKQMETLVRKLDKAWARLKIARAGGSRGDFQSYETVLYEFIKASREMMTEHEQRIQAIEKRLNEAK
jgi:hypothetical protein